MYSRVLLQRMNNHYLILILQCLYITGKQQYEERWKYNVKDVTTGRTASQLSVSSTVRYLPWRLFTKTVWQIHFDKFFALYLFWCFIIFVLQWQHLWDISFCKTLAWLHQVMFRCSKDTCYILLYIIHQSCVRFHAFTNEGGPETAGTLSACVDHAVPGELRENSAGYSCSMWVKYHSSGSNSRGSEHIHGDSYLMHLFSNGVLGKRSPEKVCTSVNRYTSWTYAVGTLDFATTL